MNGAFVMRRAIGGMESICSVERLDRPTAEPCTLGTRRRVMTGRAGSQRYLCDPAKLKPVGTILKVNPRSGEHCDTTIQLWDRQMLPQHESTLLLEMHAAMDRIADGNYGSCVQCD